MIRSYIVAAVLATAYMVAVLLATIGFSTSASAGMGQDLANCTAAVGLSSAVACTRVMKSGRLRDEQYYIGYFNRGTAYRRAGDFEKARADFDRVVKLRPKFARGFHARALTEDDLGDRGKALADLQRAIDLDPRDWIIYFSRAKLLRAQRDFDGAMADLDKAADLEPKGAQARLLRALVMSDKGDSAGAREEINKVISEGHGGYAAYYARAAVAFDETRLDAASDDLDKALKLRKSFAAADVLMGRVLEARGDKEGAKARYQQALDTPLNFLEVRTAQATARERLDALASPDVALNVHSEPPVPKVSRKIDCKRFLPATGTIISYECSK
jgi:tetratricopeptide (TPR) repeat protein